MFGPLGGQELLLLFVIALIVFGPRKLPEIGKSLGKMLGEFRRASSDLKRTIEDEVEADRLRQLTAQTYGSPATTPPAGTSSVPPVPPAPDVEPGDQPAPAGGTPEDVAPPSDAAVPGPANPPPDASPDATREP
jgi:Tat protein translocase TatB subunit